MNIEDIAAICHNANYDLCHLTGDHSQEMWGRAQQWQIDSAMEGVQFHLDNPDAPPSATHDSWMKSKVNDGWEWGEVKDPDNKLHPCLVPFEELDPVNQAKDVLFSSIVKSLKGLLDE